MVTVASGGAPLAIAGAIVKDPVAAMAASHSVAAGIAAKAAADVVGVAAVGETALAAAVAVEGAIATSAASVATAAASTATGVASTVAATNFWNPVGWALGGIVIGAHETAPQTISWDCYKSIICEDPETTVKPMLLAELVVHPMVARVEISGKATSAGLPDF
ncbi:hypothetical protein FANTH_11968 [Fusarium anthophilum]|uniref:Uncharacterized protein n=1 Tax=Fusarium anthophilum TaxID=48485 RepID=A0A8H4YV21_9HYPO|nr:hypothetical protein FANTH_11968 [Fusarium anthophilum]